MSKELEAKALELVKLADILDKKAAAMLKSESPIDVVVTASDGTRRFYGCRQVKPIDLTKDAQDFRRCAKKLRELY